MAIEDNLEDKQNHVRLVLSGSLTMFQVTALVVEATTYCRTNQHSRLLVNGMDIEIEIPTTFQRYHFATEIAKVAQGAVRIVIVTKPEIIDPAKFGITVAGNRNLAANIFATEEEALEWLLEE